MVNATRNDLAIIMANSLQAAQWLSTAATQDRGPSPLLRDTYIEAMHAAMIAAEQARQMLTRPGDTADARLLSALNELTLSIDDQETALGGLDRPAMDAATDRFAEAHRSAKRLLAELSRED